MQHYCLYRSNSFWNTYPKEHHNVCYLAITLYVLMYFLQLFWFSKILDGFLKAVGLNLDGKASKKVKDE